MIIDYNFVGYFFKIRYKKTPNEHSEVLLFRHGRDLSALAEAVELQSYSAHSASVFFLFYVCILYICLHKEDC